MEHKFKVGDKVVGKSNTYGITNAGWIGYVTEVYGPVTSAGITTDIRVSNQMKRSDGIPTFAVYSEYFDLVEAFDPTNVQPVRELTVADIVKDNLEYLSVERLNISCGIRGIEAIKDFYLSLPVGKRKECMEYFLENVGDLVNSYHEQKGALYTISPLETYDQELLDILNKYAVYKTGYHKNPNSDNNIQLLVYEYSNKPKV